jgi:cytochrome P450
MAILREESRPAFQGATMNVQHITNNCPRLDSAYYETLRLVNGAMSIRKVHAYRFVSGKLLKADNTVVIPYREIHYNPNVWGDSVSQFDPDRLFQKAKLSSHPSYRPFGGGASYCPGRHLAKAEVCGFVAAFINRFDVELQRRADGSMQPFPTLDMTKPSTGITSCMPDMDLFVKI